MNARVAIILVNWHGWRDTIDCLSSLGSLQHDSFSIIVVDNASADDSVPRLMDWLQHGKCADLNFQGTIDQAFDKAQPALAHRQVLLVRARENGGFAAGVNVGLRLALAQHCSACWILNNDTTVDPAALSALERCQADDPRRGIVGSLLCYHDEPKRVQVVGGAQFDFLRVMGQPFGEGLQVDDPRVVELAKLEPTYVAGASMLVSQRFLQAVGLMEERYFLYFEELDWSVRSSGQWRRATALGSVVFHKEGGSIGTSSRALRSLLSQFYMVRSLVSFYRRHKPVLLPVALARTLRDIARFWMQGEARHAKVTWAAMCAGLAGEVGRRTASFGSPFR